jgi:lipoprotein-anchoring transpeptidase ErfK/SrfK
MNLRGLLFAAFALALATSSGVATADGFASVSSGKRLPDAPAPVPAGTPNPFMTTPGAAETPNPFMTTPGAAGTPNPFMTTPGAAETPNPFMTTPGAAGGEAPNPFMATPAAPCENPNPFMTAGRAACDSSNPFVPPAVDGSGPAVPSGSSGTMPFGVAYADAVAAGPTRLEAADRIVVKKSERRLYLLQSDRVLREYPVRLGLNPYGPKQREGDFRTPEGVYTLSRRNTSSDFFLSLEVSYPNEADRDRARRSGVSPGGLIMIHGQPNVPRKSPEYYASNDWTDGCIAVSNSDMVDIWLRTSVGTPIEIQP